jgi:hypothetical protein
MRKQKEQVRRVLLKKKSGAQSLTDDVALHFPTYFPQQKEQTAAA